MEPTHDMIDRFFNGQCTPAEERLVKRWLLQNPDVLDKYMTEAGWEQFSAGGDRVEASVRMRTYINRQTRAVIAWRKWVAAACILILTGLGGGYLFLNHRAPEHREVMAATNCVLINNTSLVVKELKLPDGSIVKLAANSAVSYDPVFTGRRDIVLVGAASFSVAKDPSKPFCVHAKNINVTALGTMFNVDDKDSVFTNVRLYEGKVVIRGNPYLPHTIKAVFLTPGEEYRFNNVDFSNAVSRFDENKQKNKIAASPVLLTKVSSFNNEPLGSVFREIEKYYQVKISFDAEAVKDMNFTGVYRPSAESVEDFLNTIALLNNLSITKTKNGFSISPN